MDGRRCRLRILSPAVRGLRLDQRQGVYTHVVIGLAVDETGQAIQPPLLRPGGRDETAAGRQQPLQAT